MTAYPPDRGHRRAPPGFEDTRRALILGTNGMGKTTLVRFLLKSVLRSSRILALDLHRAFVDILKEVDSLEALRREFGRPEWRVAYCNDRLEAESETLARAACGAGSCTFVVDELSMLCTPSYIGPQLKRLVEWCRHKHVGYLVGARQPRNEIHPIFRALSWEVFSFHIADADHLKTVRGLAGREFAERVAALPPHRCLWRNLYNAAEPMQELTPPLS